MLGAAKLNSLAAAAVASGPVTGVSNTWDTWTTANPITGVSRWTGMPYPSVTIHGVTNTDKLVMSFICQNSARTSHTLYGGVFDLTTKTFAISSGTAIGNQTSDYSVGGIAASVNNAAGQASQYGMLAVAHYTGTGNLKYRAYGYSISNWSTVSTSSPPTFTLSSVYEWSSTSGFWDHPIGCVALPGTGGTGGRFLINRRDNQTGDYSTAWVLNHNGASAPTIYKTVYTGGAQGSGQVFPVHNGITTSTNWAAFYSMPGNNANTIANHFRQGNASNDKVTISDAGFGSFGGSWFYAVMYKDYTGDVNIISQVNASGTSKHSATRWTNANSPTVNPSVSNSTVRTNIGLFPAFVPAGDLTTNTTNHTIYVPQSTTGNAARFDTWAVTSGASFGLGASLTSGQTAAANTYYSSWDYYAIPWYNATHGQWIIAWQHNTSTSIGNIHFHKWNP